MNRLEPAQTLPQAQPSKRGPWRLLWLAADFFGRTLPDYQIAYVGSSALPEQTDDDPLVNFGVRGQDLPRFTRHRKC